MSITIAIETPLQDDVRVLVKALNDYMMPLSPPEFQFQMTVEQMAQPDTTLFVARDVTGKAVGCGALRMHDDGIGEVKRMFASPEMRGTGLGATLLNAVENLAREKGVTRLVLETGTGEGFAPATRLYQRAGFTRCGAVLDYPDSEHNVFFEKRLNGAA